MDRLKLIWLALTSRSKDVKDAAFWLETGVEAEKTFFADLKNYMGKASTLANQSNQVRILADDMATMIRVVEELSAYARQNHDDLRVISEYLAKK